MVGTRVDGQLRATVAGSHARVRFALATAADDAAIRRLLRENPTRGAISLSFEREPDYFRGANVAAVEDRTIVAFDNGGLVCMGRCTTRDAWINQRVSRVGYLAELRLDRLARGRVDILRGGYQFFRELHRQSPADFYFTSIASDNDRARRFLERGLPGFPRYDFMAELTTILVSTKISRVATVAPESATSTELAEFFQESGAAKNLSVAWTQPTLASLAAHNLELESFGVIREHGRIVAAGALWDQRPFRQIVIRDYTPMLAFARPLLKAIGRLAGFPVLPRKGTVLSHAFLSPLATASDRAAILPDLVARFAESAARRGIDFLTLALPSGDPRLDELQRYFRCRTYRSRIYRVSWPGYREVAPGSSVILPDVSLL
jgi:hypothetical protein